MIIESLSIRDLQIISQVLTAQLDAGLVDMASLAEQVDTAISLHLQIVRRSFDIDCPECGKKCRVYPADGMIIAECPLRGGCGYSEILEGGA